VLGLAALVAILCACHKSGHDLLLKARSQLASADYQQAIATARAGLHAEPSRMDAFGLELVLLEAHARGGDGESAKRQLVKLAELYPKQLSATDYSSTAQQLQEAGEGPAAIEVLDLGKKRHPDDPLIERMIAEAASGESSPEELDMLKSLGYIE